MPSGDAPFGGKLEGSQVDKPVVMHQTRDTLACKLAVVVSGFTGRSDAAMMFSDTPPAGCPVE